MNPELLGMTKVASEDPVRRALPALEEAESEQWLRRHLKASYEPLLEEPWAMDIVQPLYGHREDAQVGYNPSKPGRPSHAYHSYFIANLRMVMDVEVQAGNLDGVVVCAAGDAGDAGRAGGAAPSGVCAWRLRLGGRSGRWKEPSNARFPTCSN